MLGRMHRVGQNFSQRYENTRGPHWWRVTAEQVMERLPEVDGCMLQEEIAFQASHRKDELPRGVIHADLFRDNALFQGDELTGVIDFYYACTDVLIYDLAVIANDWCSSQEGVLDESRTRILLQSYHAERPLTERERAGWPVMLRAGALRFWLSRTQDKLFPRPGEITHIKESRGVCSHPAGPGHPPRRVRPHLGLDRFTVNGFQLTVGKNLVYDNGLPRTSSEVACQA